MQAHWVLRCFKKFMKVRKEYAVYHIKRASKRITSMLDKEWEKAEIAYIDKVNWKEYPNIPNTTGRILHSDYGLHVLMQTDEQPLLARYTAQNSEVCCDSCMELFISPNCDDKRYLNFEFNPFGTMYLGVRTSRFDCEFPKESKEYFEVQSFVDEKRWMLQFTIPFEFIDKIFGKHTNNMRANMYKCTEDGQVEHYASLFRIDTPEADFHRPEFFGEFILCD